jgi:hypothetical protein
MQTALMIRRPEDINQIDGVWQKNQMLRERWRKHEAEQAAPGQHEAWLEQIEQRANTHDLPSRPLSRP